MLKFNRKLAALTVVGAMSFSGLQAANVGLPVQDGKWQLIGVTGLHQEKIDNSTAGSSGGSVSYTDISMGDTDLAIVDINDDANMVTWDANSSIGNKTSGSDVNGYATTNNGTGNIFTDDGLAWAATADAVVTYENNGTTYGTADHSILGVQALKHTDTTLTAVAAVINYDKAVNYKNYNSPMRVMYLRSDKVTKSSSSNPDVKIIYQASMEGQMFKLQFTDTAQTVGSAVTLSDFDFAKPASGDRTGLDRIYTGYFRQAFTYESPAEAGTTFPLLSGYSDTTSSSSGTTAYSYKDYGRIDQVFDMNLTNNSTNCPTSGGSAFAPDYFDPTDTDYSGVTQSECIQRLEGNLTVYEWDNTASVDSWKQGWFYRSTRSTVSTDSYNTIEDNSLKAGKGYWVKYDGAANGTLKTNYDTSGVTTASLPGFLVSDTLTKESYDSTLVKEGWNLISFEDDNIRYSTTGLALAGGTAAKNFYVNTNNHEKRFTIAGADPETVCKTFNGKVEDYNVKGGINKVNIRCYPGTGDFNQNGTFDGTVADAGVILISDRTFSIDIAVSAVNQTDNNVSTLAGAALDAFYDGNVTLTTGVMTGNVAYGTGLRYTSRFGEYAVGMLLNAHMFEDDGDLVNRGKIGIRIPSYDTVAGEDAIMDVNLTSDMNFQAGTSDKERFDEFYTGTANTYAINKVGATGTAFAASMLPVPYGVDIYTASTIEGYTSGYGQAKATVWNIAVDGATAETSAVPGLHDGNETLLVASNKRFYVRDTTAVRVFTVNSAARSFNWGVSIDDGTAKGTNLNLFTVHDANATNYGDNNCSAISDEVLNTAAGFTVLPYCVDYNASIGSGIDKNTTVMFISEGSSTSRYFDIREANESTAAGVISTVTFDDSANITYPFMDALTEVKASTIYRADGNVTYGAVAHAYTGSKLASMNIDDKDNVPVGIKYVNTDTTSVAADYSVEDLTNTPLYAEDFPNDGPLYFLTQISDGAGGYLKPEVFLTAVTANDSQGAIDSNVITWKAVDVTRDPSEWFDDANNFDLFQTDAGRGYWVYASAGGVAPDQIVTVTNGTPTLTSYVHIDNNDLGEGSSTTANYYASTYNHVSGTISTAVTGLWRSNDAVWGTYTSGSSFNVIASLGGYDNRMTPTAAITSTGSGTFTMDLNDYDTAGLDFTTVGTTQVEMNVSAVDGIGGRNSQTSNINYIKPAAPVVTDVGLDQTVTSAMAKYLYLYEGNVSDINFNSSKYIKITQPMSGGATSSVAYNLLGATFLGAFPYKTTTIDAATAITSLDKDDWATSYAEPATDLRYITATDDITNYGSSEVYLSNQYQGSYIPFYAKTHILEVATAGGLDQDPKRYGLATAAVAGIDGGVQLEGIVPVTMSYYPMLLESDVDGSGVIDAADVTASTPNGLLAGQGVYSMHVGDESDNLIAKITYNTAYVGKYFYVYAGSQLYWGIFPDFGNTGSLSTTTESNPFQLMKFAVSKPIAK